MPTLRYRSGDIQIEDRSEQVPDSESPLLRRELTLTTGEETRLFMRVLKGAIEPAGPSVFRRERVQVRLPGRPTHLRQIDGTEDKELLLELQLERGTHTLVIDYALDS